MPLSDLARLVDDLVAENERLKGETLRLRRKCNRLRCKLCRAKGQRTVKV